MHVYGSVHMSTEEGIRSSGAGVIDSCHLPNTAAKNLTQLSSKSSSTFNP